MSEQTRGTLDLEDAARFERLASLWWDVDGPFRPLHRMNELRVQWILSEIHKHFDQYEPESANRLAGLTVLDVGCGGGILSEAMASLGATVTGIDVVEKNLKIARHHAEKGGLAIDYRSIAVEDLSHTGQVFDVVLNMEVVEHVGDLPLFLKSAAKLVRPTGLMFVATLNRTAISYLVAIIGAEYIFGWLPRGTHQWRKFVSPKELVLLLQPERLKLVSSTGVWMNPFTQAFYRVPSMAVNFITCFQKPKDPL